VLTLWYEFKYILWCMHCLHCSWPLTHTHGCPVILTLTPLRCCYYSAYNITEKDCTLHYCISHCFCHFVSSYSEQKDDDQQPWHSADSCSVRFQYEKGYITNKWWVATVNCSIGGCCTVNAYSSWLLMLTSLNLYDIAFEVLEHVSPTHKIKKKKTSRHGA
jgi:hypothetical protein